MPAATLATSFAPLPLSVHLRTATRAEHEQAETMGFIEALMGGTLGVEAYADLAAQHHVIYSALEACEPAVQADPAGATLVFDELRRVPSIEADLMTLLGQDWRDRVRILPATLEYAQRLHDVAGGWVGGYAAHAYTRYLGDLSGGLAIKAILQRSYGVPDDAVNFYTFPGIPKPKLFKDEYRARLDALPADEAERGRIAEEARMAFRLNMNLYAALAPHHM